MPHRLTSIVTRTGDDGTTGLGDNTRRAKDDPRIVAMGDIDELNSQLGVLLAQLHASLMSVSASLSVATESNFDIQAANRLAQHLDAIQHDLFDLGAEICIPGHQALQAAHLQQLDQLIADYGAALPKLKEFILPGGSLAAAQAHVCRSVCRRAERSLVHLAQVESLAPLPGQYLNRLSDLLFMLARCLNRLYAQPDVLWQPARYKASTA